MRILWWIVIVVAYCVPSLVAGGLVAFAHVEVHDQVLEKVKSVQQQAPSETRAESSVEQKLRDVVSGPDWDTDAEIKARIWQLFWPRFIMVAALTLLPFLVLGGGRAYRYYRSPGRERLKRALSYGLVTKFIMTFIIMLGWAYFFFPKGEYATIVHELVKSVDTANSIPSYFDKWSDGMAHLLAAFLGWYLHLLGYIFPKLYRGDVGTKVYAMLVRRALFVIGIGWVLRTVSAGESVVPAFLIGFFPLMAVSILREYGLVRFSDPTSRSLMLSELPAISRWQILRLEEEGVMDAADLLDLDTAAFAEESNIPLEKVLLWLDVAALATVVGSGAYQKLQPLCRAATTFARRAHESEFAERVQSLTGIEDCREVERALRAACPRLFPETGADSAGSHTRQ